MIANANRVDVREADLDVAFHATSDLDPNQRVDERHELQTDGQLTLPNGFKIPIRVVDMSRSGARLHLLSYVVLPNEFEVEIFSPDRTKLKITTSSRQWQRQNECGVKFLTARTELLEQYS